MQVANLSLIIIMCELYSALVKNEKSFAWIIHAYFRMTLKSQAESGCEGWFLESGVKLEQNLQLKAVITITIF